MKLASCEKITALDPIEGADFIVRASLLGWQIVVKKDEFKVGNLVAYIQINTIVPEKEEFEFLRERDFRVRTIKLRKQISQGLIVPLPPGNWNEGDDLTEALGVKKYNKGGEGRIVMPAKPKIWYKKLWYILKTFNRNKFPTNLVSITDEERIQNMPHILQTYAGRAFVVSEKLDGSSIIIIRDRTRWGKVKYRVCSRRFELFNDKNEWHGVFYSTNFAEHIEKLVKYFETTKIIVQGEFIGKPQGNKYKLEKDEIRLFNIIVDGRRIEQTQFTNICEMMQIPAVPFLETRPMDFDLPGILAYADGKSKLRPETAREGVVFRAVGDQLSFKVISNKWLLANNE